LAELVERIGEVIVVVFVDLSVEMFTSMTGAPFATTTVTAVAVAWLPAASRARAASVCVPFVVLDEFQEIEYGGLSTSAPIDAPSSRNCTPTTPLLSEALADRLTAVPLTTLPFAGAVIATVGGNVSGLNT